MIVRRVYFAMFSFLLTPFGYLLRRYIHYPCYGCYHFNLSLWIIFGYLETLKSLEITKDDSQTKVEMVTAITRIVYVSPKEITERSEEKWKHSEIHSPDNHPKISLTVGIIWIVMKDKKLVVDSREASLTWINYQFLIFHYYSNNANC